MVPYDRHDCDDNVTYLTQSFRYLNMGVVKRRNPDLCDAIVTVDIVTTVMVAFVIVAIVTGSPGKPRQNTAEQ